MTPSPPAYAVYARENDDNYGWPLRDMYSITKTPHQSIKWRRWARQYIIETLEFFFFYFHVQLYGLCSRNKLIRIHGVGPMLLFYMPLYLYCIVFFGNGVLMNIYSIIISRSFAKPPKPVQQVCECIVVMKGIKEVSWKSAKGMMSEANFLKSLKEMNVDAITAGQLKIVKGAITIRVTSNQNMFLNKIISMPIWKVWISTCSLKKNI